MTHPKATASENPCDSFERRAAGLPLRRPFQGGVYIILSSYIFRVMAKRLIDIDDDLLERARAAAGTPTIKATVEAGLRRLAEQAIVVQHIRRLRRAGTLSRAKLSEARASRVRLE